jgi:hypothetical protein
LNINVFLLILLLLLNAQTNKFQHDACFIEEFFTLNVFSNNSHEIKALHIKIYSFLFQSWVLQLSAPVTASCAPLLYSACNSPFNMAVDDTIVPYSIEAHSLSLRIKCLSTVSRSQPLGFVRAGVALPEKIIALH